MNALLLAAMLFTGAQGGACKRACTKAYVPCNNTPGQILCLKVVRRCEVTCPRGAKRTPTTRLPPRRTRPAKAS